MGERYFVNEMPDMVEDHEEETVNVVSQDSLKKLLSLPYTVLSERLKSAGLDLKETRILCRDSRRDTQCSSGTHCMGPTATVVEETWRVTGGRVNNFILYCGTLGTAFLLFKSYQVTSNKEDLTLCYEIVKACDTASRDTRDGTFICGRPGVHALGAVVAKHLGEDELLKYHVSQFKKIDLPGDAPDELLYGRAGFVWACLFINKHVNEEAISQDYIVRLIYDGIVNDIFTSGRRLGVKARCPLMFEKYGERMLGAANGIIGITHVLMHVKLSPDQADDVKGTLKYMIKNRIPNGKYHQGDHENNADSFVQWSDGAPGVVLTLVKAAEVFGDKEFAEAATNMSDFVWKHGLLRRVSICHGVSGNTYVFLALYRLTGNQKYLYRAKAFACFLLDRAHMLILEGQMDRGENPYSLFEGIGGMSYLFLDMTKREDARFPSYEL